MMLHRGKSVMSSAAAISFLRGFFIYWLLFLLTSI